jgi:dCTP diphosphatase
MTFEQFQQLVVKFRDDRDWKQFHNPKDSVLSLTLEAAELLEHFQWKTIEEMEVYVDKNKEKISEELVDVFFWVLLMSHDLGINMDKAFAKKMVQNRKKYPISKFKGTHKKYTEL